MGPTNALGQIKPMRTLGTSREAQATNMADIPSVELIEFVRPYSNEVNLYVTSISKRLDKETAQVKLFIFVQRPLFFVPADKNSIHWLFFKPLYNGRLFTWATFFCPQCGRCRERELRLYLAAFLNFRLNFWRYSPSSVWCMKFKLLIHQITQKVRVPLKVWFMINPACDCEHYFTSYSATVYLTMNNQTWI